MKINVLLSIFCLFEIFIQVWREPDLEPLLEIFVEHGKRSIYFSAKGEQMPNFEGNRETKTFLGNRQHQKTDLR